MRNALIVILLASQACAANDDPSLMESCQCGEQIASAISSALDTATVQDQALDDAIDAEVRARLAAEGETREQFDWMSARLRDDVGMLNDKILRLQARLDALGAP